MRSDDTVEAMPQPTLPRITNDALLPGAEFVRAYPQQFNDALMTDRRAPSEHSFDVLAPDGYLHAMRDLDPINGWTIGIGAGEVTTVELLMAATHEVASRGGGPITWWRAAASESDDRVAARVGFLRSRTQHQMRVKLPIAFDTTPSPTLEIRAFEPGRDDDAWLDLNNAAFEGHDDQASWTHQHLAPRVAAPWFDPTLFLVAIDQSTDQMVAFNWLKVHDANPTTGDPRLGEIYVIGVDPDRHGQGLGHLLAGLGLRRLHERGIGWAMLYVSSENTAALGLYARMGFRTHRTDHAYFTNVPAP